MYAVYLNEDFSRWSFDGKNGPRSRLFIFDGLGVMSMAKPVYVSPFCFTR